MKKVNVLLLILDLILLIVFNVIFFLIGGTDHNSSVWISYGFIHFSYLMLLLTPFLVKKEADAAVWGLPLYSVAAAYFFATFLIGIVSILIAPKAFNWVLVIQLVFTGIYAVAPILNMMKNELTADRKAKL